MTHPTLVLEDHARAAYLSYAMSVVTSRALPTLRDGQKPVQRRILYDMHILGLDHTKKPVKCARFVGDILGKFHPHGDSSVYDAAVRMSQNFMMRYPLVDGHGNFGSRDGEGAAAMRYTEARLTPIAELLLGELDLGTVDFKKNYDGTLSEPTVLPARVPMMLLNGASGIAVGMATEIPSHNLTEVVLACEHLLRNPEATLDEIMDIIPGPDFPGGAQIISSREDIAKVYLTGKGPIRTRARWTVEPLSRGQWQIAINELPPGTSTASIMQELEDLTNPQVKADKKTLTPVQSNLKALILSVVDKITDESTIQNPIRLVIHPKSSRQTPEEVMQVLLANTSLECNFSANMVMLLEDNSPKPMGLLPILHNWIAFRLETVRRRTESRVAAIDSRLHILNGRLTAFNNLSKVIDVIRTSDKPKEVLMDTYGLSEIQAQDILEIRLRQLAKLEQYALETEIEKLSSERSVLHELLTNKIKMRNQILSELEADRKKFGDTRRTLIESAERVTTASVAVAADDPITVIVSKQGWLRARTGHRAELSTLTWKPGDSALSILETRTNKTLVVLDATGRVYNVPLAQIPTGRGDGVPLSSLCTLATNKLVSAFVLEEDKLVFFSSNDSYGFMCPGDKLATRQKAGKEVVALQGDAKLLPAQVVPNDLQGEIVVCTTNSKMLVFPASEMKVMAKGRGLQLVAMSDKDKITCLKVTSAPIMQLDVYLDPAPKQKHSMLAFNNEELAKFRGKRARAGGTLPDKGVANSVIALEAMPGQKVSKAIEDASGAENLETNDPYAGIDL